MTDKNSSLSDVGDSILKSGTEKRGKPEWSLREDGKELEPLQFSNGKTQQDVVGEILEAIDEGYKIIFVKGVCGSGKCLDKDSLIFCKPKSENYGYYKISNLVGKEGKINSVDKKGKIIETDFKNVRKSGEKDLYRLRTRTGREITASKNHPLLTITRKGVEWKPLEEINENSYICLPNNIDCQGKKQRISDSQIKILAHLIAEGKLGDNAGSPRYYQNQEKNPKVRQDYINALSEYFPEGEVKERKNEVDLLFHDHDTREGTTNKLRLFVREHGLDGKGSNEKFVPNIIFNLEESKISLFLRVLFSCDGSIYYKKSKKRKKQPIIEYDSISKKLIDGISLLLSKFGIHHTITSKSFREQKEYAYRITVSNQRNIRKFIENVGFIGRKQILARDVYKKSKDHRFSNFDKVPRIIRDYLKDKGYSYNQLDRFQNYEEIEKHRKNKGFKQIRKDDSIETPYIFRQQKIDFLRGRIDKINRHIVDKNIGFICSKDIIWDKVKSIDYLKRDTTYDLEVPKYNNFIADGVIVHNSAMALNLAKEFDKTSIVVPVKALQKQYEHDYSNKKHVLKNGKKLKIDVIKGRSNFECPFLKNNYSSEDLGAFDEDFLYNKSCSNPKLPCRIEIKKQNEKRLREYVRKNDRTKNDLTISDIRRLSIAPVCPYWSPIVPSEIDLSVLDSRCKSYQGLNDKKYDIHQRKKGCGYYDQYESYLNSDVLIFNSYKYLLETVMNRKPATDLEIIDECDEFLDSLSNQKTINLNRLAMALGGLFSEKEEGMEAIRKITDLTNSILRKKPQKKIVPIGKTRIKELLRLFLDTGLMSYVECDDENYCYHLEEVAKTFQDFFDQTYLSFESDQRSESGELIVKLVTTNIEKRFKNLLEKNKVFVLMSGTIHSQEVLKEIFGISDFKIIEAETEDPGKLTVRKTGFELNCKYKNFREGRINREQYLYSLNRAVKKSEKPTLVHITSFFDLPTREEKEKLGLDLMTRDEIKRTQNKDKGGEIVNRFKEGQMPVLYTTKCNRGADFPGDTCNSIVITKFPYPNIGSLFWQILRKNKPKYFNEFYMDKSRRELLQRIYRGLRSEKDHVYLLSPDSRIFDRLPSEFSKD